MRGVSCPKPSNGARALRLPLPGRYERGRVRLEHTATIAEMHKGHVNPRLEPCGLPPTASAISRTCRGATPTLRRRRLWSPALPCRRRFMVRRIRARARHIAARSWRDAALPCVVEGGQVARPREARLGRPTRPPARPSAATAAVAVSAPPPAGCPRSRAAAWRTRAASPASVRRRPRRSSC